MSKMDMVRDKLLNLGAPLDVAAALAKNITDEKGTTGVNSHAEGGKGGHAISLTYVDNYSTMMLVYTFLLHSLDDDQKATELNQSLLATLQIAMKEQQLYRNAFLEAVNKLNQS